MDGKRGLSKYLVRKVKDYWKDPEKVIEALIKNGIYCSDELIDADIPALARDAGVSVKEMEKFVELVSPLYIEVLLGKLRELRKEYEVQMRWFKKNMVITKSKSTAKKRAEQIGILKKASDYISVLNEDIMLLRGAISGINLVERRKKLYIENISETQKDNLIKLIEKLRSDLNNEIALLKKLISILVIRENPEMNKEISDLIDDFSLYVSFLDLDRIGELEAFLKREMRGGDETPVLDLVEFGVAKLGFLLDRVETLRLA